MACLGDLMKTRVISMCLPSSSPSSFNSCLISDQVVLSTDQVVSKDKNNIACVSIPIICITKKMESKRTENECEHGL